MKEAFEHFISEFTEDLFEQIVTEVHVGEEKSLAFLLSEIIANKDKVVDRFFPYVKEYLDNPDFYKLFDLDNEEHLLSIGFCAAIFGNDFLRRVYEAKGFFGDIVSEFLFIHNMDDYNFFRSSGMRDEDIASSVHIFEPSVVDLICEKNPELISNIIETDSFAAMRQLARIYAEGNREIADSIDKYNEPEFLDFLANLSVYEIDFKDILETIRDRYDRNISIITNEEVALNAIKNWGHLAILFVDNPSEAVVEAASDFSLSDYLQFEGSFKDSTALLMKFLRKGQVNALYHTNDKAINDDVIQFIKDNNVPLDEITKHDNLTNNFNINKLLVENGEYYYLSRLEDISSLEKVSYLFELYSKGEVSFSSLYSLNRVNALIYSLATGNKRQTRARLRPEDISEEAINYLISKGMDVDFYLKNCYPADFISKILFTNGYKEALFLMNNPSFIQEHYTDDMYNEALDFLKVYGNEFQLADYFICQFIKNKHYDFLDYIVILSTGISLEDLGMENISLDEYLALPEKVRNLECLRSKFLDYDPEKIFEVLQKEGNFNYIIRALKAGIDPARVWPIVQKFSYCDLESASIFVKHGFFDVVNYCGYNSHYEEVREFVELYYKKSGGRIPSFQYTSFEFQEVFLKYYIEKGKMEILKTVHEINIDVAKFAVEHGFDFEMFKKYGLYEGSLIACLLNENNEDEIYQYLMELGSDISFNNFAEVVIKYIDSNLNKEHLKLLTSNYSVNIYPLANHYKGREEEFLLYVDRHNLYDDPIMMDKMLSILSPDDIANDLKISGYNNMSEKARVLLIRKMVMLGHYDFVKYYNVEIDDEILKRAVMSGYVPPRIAGSFSSDIYRRHIRDLKFTNEELDYLRSKVKDCPLLFIFLPEVMNDVDAIAKAIIDNPSSIPLIGISVGTNMALLEKLVVQVPEIASNYLYNLSPDVINQMILLNDKIIDYLDDSLITDQLIDLVVVHHPNIIDKAPAVDYSRIFNALAHGYVFNENTSQIILNVAFSNKKEIPKEIFNSRMEAAFDLALSAMKSSNYTQAELLYYFDNLFEYLKNYDNDEFLFQGSKFCFYNVNGIPGEYHQLFEKYGLFNNEYYKELFESKDNFLLFKFIFDNNITAQQIDSLEERIDKASDKYKTFVTILNAFSKNSNDPKYIEFQHRIAKKHFTESPFDYALYADSNDPEIIEMAKEALPRFPEIYKRVHTILLDKNIVNHLLDMGYDVYNILDKKIKNDLKILVKALELNPRNIYEIDQENKKVKEFLIRNIEKYPFIFIAYPEILQSKEILLKCLSYNDGEAFYYMPQEFKQDYDVCLAYLKIDVNHIFLYDEAMPRFDELFFMAISMNPNIIMRCGSFKEHITQEIYDYVIDKVPRAFEVLPDKLLTLENYTKIPDKGVIDYNSLPLDFINKLINDDLLDLDDAILCNKILDLVVKNAEYFADKMTDKMIALFSRTKIVLENNDELFKGLLGFGADFDYSLFGPQYVDAFKNGLEILNATGKINTITKNPIFGFDVCKYIYPLFGLQFTLDLIKYNTKAAQVIATEIKDGNSKMLLEYYSFIKKTGIFDNDDRFVHFAFRNFDSIKILVTDLLVHKDELTDDDIKTFGRIVANENYYQIDNLASLRNYDKITLETANKKLESSDIQDIKIFVCRLLGLSFAKLSDDFNAFQLDNFEKFSYIRKEIIEKLGKDKGNEIWSKLFYTKEETAIVLFLQRVIKSNNIEEIKDLIKIHLNDKDKGIDFAVDFDRIVDKVRKIYNLEFNLNLSKPDQIKSPRMSKDDPNNPYGVTVIDMDGEEFNFMAHRLYSYDAAMSGFSKMLIDDPSLWTKLEGASTLSTSSFSDKGFWFLHAESQEGVVYLFSELPESFMLFMYGRDLFVEHGGYKLEPTANQNSFSDINALNQSSCYHSCSYNEVAGFRQGMIPSAIACVGDTPTEDQIRAAKYFSQLTGRDVPIIKFNIKKYNERKQAAFIANKNAYQSSLDSSLIPKIIMNGCDTNVTNLVINADFVFNILKEKYQAKDIDLRELIRQLAVLSSTVNRLENDNKEVVKLSRRIAIYRRSIIALASLTPEQTIMLENAGLGESGIMYRLETEEGKFLVKPAVEKQNFDYQPFRAEIQAAASRLQTALSPESAVNVQMIETNGVSLSKQELLDLDSVRKDELERWARSGGEFDENTKKALLQEYVVDFLLCNFDCFAGNFVIDSKGQVRGVDKEQSFRFIDDPASLNPDFSYTPNGMARVPIYQIMFQRYRNNELTLDLNVILDTIKKVEEIPEEQYREMFTKYAIMFKGEGAQAFLDKICERRTLAIEKMKEFVKELDSDIKMGVEL